MLGHAPGTGPSSHLLFRVTEGQDWTLLTAALEGKVNPDHNTCLHGNPVLLSGFIQLKAPVSMGALANKRISAKCRLLQVLTISSFCLPASSPRMAPEPQEAGRSQLCLVPAATTSQLRNRA